MNIAHVTYCENVALVTLRNVPSEGTLIGEIFTAIADGGINVDMISQTAPQGGTISLAFTVSTDSVGILLPVLNGFKPATPDLGVELTAGMTKLNFSDESMVHTPGVAAGVFSALAAGGVSPTMITTSTVDISLLIPAHQQEAALAVCKHALAAEPVEAEFD